MPSSIVAPPALLAFATTAAALLNSGCAGSRQARLDAHGVAVAPGTTARPGMSGMRAPGDIGSGTNGDGSAAESSTAVRADHALEARLRRELADKHNTAGAAALEVIEPGSSVDSRLRFALSRILLGRRPQAATALHALTTDAPDCALAWLLLGQVRADENDAPAAVACLRRARALEREQALAPHPALDFLLARALLESDEIDEGVRLLREQLAAGPHRVAAAELLAQVEGETGDFAAALAALDAVLDDAPGEPTLVAAKAELLGDQLRFDDALAHLDAHGASLGEARLAQCRAQLHRQRGDLRTAVAVIDAALAQPATTSAAAQARSSLETTRAALAHEHAQRKRESMRIREVLGLMRYARQPIERVAAFRLLCQSAPPHAVQAAVRWALRDPADAVRIAAIQGGLPQCENAAELLHTGLADAAAAVRAATAGAAARQQGRPVLMALVQAIERENDPEAFRAMHRALTVVSGRELPLPFDGERTAEVRARVAKEWRREVERVGKDAPGS